MNLNVSLIAGVYDAFDLGDTRAGAALDPMPTFMTMRLDRALAETGRRARTRRGNAAAVREGRCLASRARSVGLLDDVGLRRSRAGAPRRIDARAGARRRWRGVLRARRQGTVTVKGAASETAPIRTGDAIPVRIGESSLFTNSGSEPLELFVMGVAKRHGGQDAVALRRAALTDTEYDLEDYVNRRGILRSAFVATAAALGVGRFAAPARAQTKHIRLYVEMDVPPAREREMLDTFHNTFVPEAVKHEGYIRVKMLKRRAIVQGTRARRITTTASSWSSRARSFARSGSPRRAISACGRSSSAP